MQGFVLLVMLVYMQMMSLLAMQGVATVIDEKKIIAHRLLLTDQRSQMLAVLSRYVDHVNYSACLVSVQSAAELYAHDLNWWRRYGCQYFQDNHEYIFVRERLGADACAVLSNEYNHVVIPVYYRNTLLYVNAVSMADAMILQDTMALPGNAQPVCSHAPKNIKPGRQMLRWL